MVSLGLEVVRVILCAINSEMSKGWMVMILLQDLEFRVYHRSTVSEYIIGVHHRSTPSEYAVGVRPSSVGRVANEWLCVIVRSIC